MAKLAHHTLNVEIAATRTVDLEAHDGDRPVSFPVRFDPGFQPGKTSLLSRVVEVWGEIPAALLESLRVRKLRYGLIGLEDFTMYPLLRPGSFVQIDDQQKPQVHVSYRSEHERPIWFLELRTGYICSWCELRRDRLVSIPHPLSPWAELQRLPPGSSVLRSPSYTQPQNFKRDLDIGYKAIRAEGIAVAGNQDAIGFQSLPAVQNLVPVSAG